MAVKIDLAKKKVAILNIKTIGEFKPESVAGISGGIAARNAENRGTRRVLHAAEVGRGQL